MDTLVADTLASHHGLEERLARAKVARPSSDPTRPREEFPAVDTFLATASRHNAALLQVLVPAARSRLKDGHKRADEFVAASRRYEEALNEVKAKLYHSAYAKRRWSAMWPEVDEAFREVWRLELALVSDLAEVRKPDDPDWAERLHRAELKSPTRPHPHIPHQGVQGKTARFVARRVDAFWDAAEGRMVPAPIRAHDHSHDSWLTQYLLASTHFDEEKPATWVGEPQRAARTGWPSAPVVPTQAGEAAQAAGGPVEQSKEAPEPPPPVDPHLDGQDGVNKLR